MGLGRDLTVDQNNGDVYGTMCGLVLLEVQQVLMSVSREKMQAPQNLKKASQHHWVGVWNLLSSENV